MVTVHMPVVTILRRTLVQLRYLSHPHSGSCLALDVYQVNIKDGANELELEQILIATCLTIFLLLVRYRQGVSVCW